MLVLPGNRALTKLAINAPATAMPAPTPAVATRRPAGDPAIARMMVDPSRSRSAPRMTLSRPNRRAIHGAGRASAPIRTSGIAIRRDTLVCERPNARWMSGRSGPTDTMPGRRLTDTMMRQAIARPKESGSVVTSLRAPAAGGDPFGAAITSCRPPRTTRPEPPSSS